MPDVPADPRVLTLHLEIQRMRAELESFEQRLEQIRLSEAAAAADTRPFAERAEELVSQMVATLHQSGMDEISAVTTEARMLAGTRLEDANRQAQRLLDAAREDLAAALTEHAGATSSVEDRTVIVLDEHDDVLVLPDAELVAPVYAEVPVDTDDDLASALDDLPVVSDHQVSVLPEDDLAAVLAALGSYAGAGSSVLEPPEDLVPALDDELVEADDDLMTPAFDGLVTLPDADLVVSGSDDVILLPDSDIVTPAFDEVALVPDSDVVVPETNVVSVEDAFVAPAPFLVPPPVVGPPTDEVVADDVDADQILAESPEIVTPEAPVAVPVPEPVAEESTVALDQAAFRESISVQEPSALRTVDPAPSGAAFDIWLALAPDAETEKEETQRETERTRSRWVRPLEVIAGLLLVVALVVVLLVLFA